MTQRQRIVNLETEVALLKSQLKDLEATVNWLRCSHFPLPMPDPFPPVPLNPLPWQPFYSPPTGPFPTPLFPTITCQN